MSQTERWHQTNLILISSDAQVKLEEAFCQRDDNGIIYIYINEEKFRENEQSL